jgi:predicted metalloprotease
VTYAGYDSERPVVRATCRTPATGRVTILEGDEQMRWQGRRQSTNVEDRRGISGGKVVLGGGVMGVVVALILGLVFGLNPGEVTDTLTQFTTAPTTAEQADEMRAFVGVVLADTEDYWSGQFEAMGRTYEAPTLVVYSGVVQTASGVATSATGPFYSPVDQTIYIDLSFYQELQQRYGAGGDAAQAYVIAHEVGHAVQDQLGILEQVAVQERGASGEQKNQLSVRTELQADFYAGLVAHYQGENRWLEPGDVQEALNAANAIGDDRLQSQAQGYVVPDSFTHGTSEQRVRWFKLGYDTGDFSKGDTFLVLYDDL